MDVHHKLAEELDLEDDEGLVKDRRPENPRRSRWWKDSWKR